MDVTNSCTPNKCQTWERGVKHSQQWNKAANRKAFKTGSHTQALSLPPPTRTNSHHKTDVKERSNLPEVTLKTALKDSVLCACVCIESALRFVSEVFKTCFIEAYCHLKTMLAYLKGSGAERVTKQLCILILKIKPKKWVQNPLKYKRCFINVWMNNWPLKHRLKKRCQWKVSEEV